MPRKSVADVCHPLADYVPLLTDRGREVAATYNPPTDDPELECRSGMPTPMWDPTSMQIIDQVQFTERFTLSDDENTLNYSMTVVDPVMFREPFTLERPRQWAPGLELEPFDCVVEWEE